MELLEILYERKPIFSTFFGRRYHIKDKKTLLIGMKKCGITSIIADFLSTLEPKSYLYIDLDDTRVDLSKLQNLQEFVLMHQITHLVVENYASNLPLPQVENIILSSHKKSLKIDGFTYLYIKPLNFEEFIGFSQRQFNSEHLFNLYANSGRLPSLTNTNKYISRLSIQELLHSSLQDELKFSLFDFFAKNQSTPTSFHKAYTHLKTKMKLSKDKLYRCVDELIDASILHFIEKLNSAKSPKKVYLSDFIWKNALTFEKDFVKSFENMVFCELELYHKDIYYTDDLHFFIPSKQKAVICIAFLPSELIKIRFKKLIKTLKSLDIKSLEVVTLGNSGKIEQDDIKCEILPFWEWALML